MDEEFKDSTLRHQTINVVWSYYELATFRKTEQTRGWHPQSFREVRRRRMKLNPESVPDDASTFEEHPEQKKKKKSSFSDALLTQLRHAESRIGVGICAYMQHMTSIQQI